MSERERQREKRKKKRKRKEFDLMRYTRMQRVGDERYLEARHVSKTKIRKEIEGVTCCFSWMTLQG